MSYPSDLTDERWALLEPVFNAPGKRGRRHGDDLRAVVDAMLYIAQTGCRWRYLPESFGPWTRVWSQFRRWSRNGTWARALTVLHRTAREADARSEGTPSMVVIDTHLARGASNGGVTFHDRGGPFGHTKGAKRVVAVDVLQNFSLRLAARRRLDAATELATWPDVADILDRQARTLGAAQYAAVREDGTQLAAAFRQAADLHDQLVHALSRTV